MFNNQYMMLSQREHLEDQRHHDDSEIDRLSSKYPQKRRGEHSQKDWKGTILIVLLFVLVGYLFNENRILHSKIEDIRMELSNSTDSYNVLQHQVFEMDLNLFKNTHHQKDASEWTQLQLKRITEAEEHERAFIHQQLTRCIRELVKIKTSRNQIKEIPKIFWLYTQHKFEGEKMVEQFLGQQALKFAKENNLIIHMVNSWNAYEFLSKEITRKITSTMQNTKMQANVNDLLRLALLKEHGGIMINVSELMVLENFDWIFGSKSQYEVLMFYEIKNWEQKGAYQDYFIAAVKEAELITDAFNILSWTITSGQLQFKQLRQAAGINEEMNSTVIKNILKNTLGSCIESMTPNFYSVKLIYSNMVQRLSPNCEGSLFRLMRNSKAEFNKACGKQKYFIRFYNREKLEEQIENSLAASAEVTDAIPRSSYWYQLLDLNKNIQLFKPLPPREVHFCLIDPEPGNSLPDVKKSVQALKMQTFQNWTMVYFMTTPAKDLTKYEELQKLDQIKFSLASQSIGQNYEQGIINICPKKSFVVTLKKKERLADKDFLLKLASSVALHGVLGAFVSINVSGDVKVPLTVYDNYNKKRYRSSESDLQNIVNHFRVFHSDCYKIIPQFELRTPEGAYYNNTFAFLEHFLFMVQNLTDLHDDTEIPHKQRVKWFIKSNHQIFSVPDQILLQTDLFIDTPTWEPINQQELKITNFKAPSYAMTYNMDHLVQNGQTMADFAIFNPAHAYEPYSKRSQAPMIPLVIHQIWIDGQLPEPKKKIMQLNQKLYPDFTFKLWTKSNITRERFPRSYDFLMNVYQADKTLRYSKKATMADIMRAELLYNEGGFYMDTSMILFNNVLHKWSNYQLVISTERTFRHRWAQSMCFFGVVPKFPGLLRIIQFNNTNRYNIYLRDALQIAGPHNFRHLIRGYEEYNKDYLILPYDSFYPMTYSLPNPFDTYCYIQPHYLKQKETILLHFKNRVLISNCSKYYPYSFGKEINSIGSSWQAPKW